MPHMKISLCTDIRQVCQYICLIWTDYNQQCDKEHWHTYISHYWHIPLNKCACHITHICPTACYCSLHTDPILMHVSVKITKCNFNWLYYCHICTNNKYALKCLIYGTCQITQYASMGEVCQYIHATYKFTGINYETSNTVCRQWYHNPTTLAEWAIGQISHT